MSNSKISKKYYGIQYLSGRHTTIGHPNPKTRRMSIACDIVVFDVKTDRDKWVENGTTTSGMKGNCRVAASKQTCRDHCAGDTAAEFEEFLERIA